ncbi:MAG: SAM-dependent methyltransferase [Chloroflexota bacterium]|jgi:tRNA-Thr(GGU) m(6)t(6)A37 methyltransferase TsaA
MSANSYQLDPIGVVSAGDDGFAIEIDLPFRDALSGLEGFSHLNVLFWCHLLDAAEYRAVTVSERPYRDGPERLGIFATRSPVRPNPIALSPVPVLSIDVETGIVRIPYIDAEPGSPVIDIKPYHPAVDRIREVSVPEWCAAWPEWLEDSMTFDWGAVFENAR